MSRLKDVEFKSVLNCDKCGSNNLKVYNSRESNEIRWRARECLMCGNRFTSYEIRKEDLDDLLQLRKCKNSLSIIKDLIDAIINKMEGGK